MQVAAERAAWEASKKDGFDLVTICPTFVVGPVISNRADATSILDVKVCHVLTIYKQHQSNRLRITKQQKQGCLYSAAWSQTGASKPCKLLCVCHCRAACCV